MKTNFILIQDIDECARGNHSCAADQQCINAAGGYLCRCAPGHKVSPQGVCVDVDECSESKRRVNIAIINISPTSYPPYPCFPLDTINTP